MTHGQVDLVAIDRDMNIGHFNLVHQTKKLSMTSDIATLQESGVANYAVVSWNALFVPAGTPPEIVNKLNGALQEILADTNVKKRLIELGIEARASTPQEISARLKSHIDKWQKVIEKAGIQKQ
jgi:tripartite-type tricarboxylate transporter receptor subunit TctC